MHTRERLLEVFCDELKQLSAQATTFLPPAKLAKFGTLAKEDWSTFMQMPLILFRAHVRELWYRLFSYNALQHTVEMGTAAEIYAALLTADSSREYIDNPDTLFGSLAVTALEHLTKFLGSDVEQLYPFATMHEILLESARIEQGITPAVMAQRSLLLRTLLCMGWRNRFDQTNCEVAVVAHLTPVAAAAPQGMWERMTTPAMN